MRFILYNIRYGAGAKWNFHFPIPFSGYLRPTIGNLGRIIEFLKLHKPDIIGLLEVDNGSYRTGRVCQAERIAKGLGFDHVYESKYHASHLANSLPIMSRQGNAFITGQTIHAKGFHYFRHGVKRLVIELEMESYVVFLVHLSLMYRHRQYQLEELYDLFRQTKKPVIVAGDFNALWGDRELALFLAATGLLNANVQRLPTYPSHAPKRQIDFILHSPKIQVTHFHVPQTRLSDHLALICDFEVQNDQTQTSKDP